MPPYPPSRSKPAPKALAPPNRKALAPTSLPLLATLACLALGLAGPSAAESIGFDGAGFPSLSDVAAADTAPASASTALIVSESDLALLTSLSTSDFATSGDQGLLNSLAPNIGFVFAEPVERVSIDVVGLPLASGNGDHAVALLAFRGDDLILELISDPTAIGDSGRAEATLIATGQRIDSIRLEPRICESGPTSCVGTDSTTSFFADTLDFTRAPEPALGLLLLSALGLVARARGDRS